MERVQGHALARMYELEQFLAKLRVLTDVQISMSEIYKLIPQLVRDFHFRLADPNKEWKTYNYWFNRQTDIWIYVDTRSHNSDFLAN